MYFNKPNKTRYSVKYRSKDGKITLKVTDDQECLQFMLHPNQDLEKLKTINAWFLANMSTLSTEKSAVIFIHLLINIGTHVLYYLISHEDVWSDVVSRISKETNEKLEDIFKNYLIKENKDIQSVGKWLNQTAAWENWFAPLLSQLNNHTSSLCLEEVYLFPACFVLLHKIEFNKESFQICVMKDHYSPNNAFHIVKELVERIASHLQALEKPASWKLTLFINLLRSMMCYQNIDFIYSIIAPVLQRVALSDLRIFLSTEPNRKEWNKFLETYRIPIANATKNHQYSFIKLTLSHFIDLVGVVTVASPENLLENEEELENMSTYLLWFYFSLQNSAMGLYLAIFIICFSDSECSDSIDPWKHCLQKLKEFLMFQCKKYSISLGRCWKLCFLVLLRILELMRKRRKGPPCPSEVSLRQLILTHLSFWKKLTGTDCCFPDISYLNALMGNNLCMIPPSCCYPSTISYLCSLFTICKAELAYKMYSALNVHKERIRTERSFIFSVTHLEQNRLLSRQIEKGHLLFSYNGQVRFLGSDDELARTNSFGRLGALFLSNAMDNFLDSSDSLHWNDIQWIGLCYSARWKNDKQGNQSSLRKFSVTFVSNDRMDWIETEKAMYLICLEAPNDIHQEVLEELYDWYTLSIANLDDDQHQEVIPEFFSSILTQDSFSLSESKTLDMLVNDETHQEICLYPFIPDAQGLLSSLASIIPGFQLEADENFRSFVYLRKLGDTFTNTSCSFVVSDKFHIPHETSFAYLYEAQKAALCASWLQRLVLIRGPPGTGKTEVANCIIRFFLQNRFVDRQQEDKNASSSVLMIVAQSNEAADHLAKKVLQKCYPKEHCYPGIDLCTHRSVTTLHPLLQPILRLGRQSNDKVIRQLTLEGHYYVMKEFRDKLWKHLSEFAKEYGQYQHSKEDNWLTNLCEAIEDYETCPYLLSKYLDQIGLSWLEATIQKYSSKEEMERSRNWKRIALLRDCILLTKCDSLLRSFHPRFSVYFKELLSHCQLVITTFASLMKYAEHWPSDGHTKIVAAIVEEAALVTEWNQFILFARYQPIRTILIGDDLQLAPIVQYRSANNDILEQLSSHQVSLFSRLIHLKFPFIQLEEQGRAAPCIADLYRFRYQKTEATYHTDGVTFKQNVLNDIYQDNHFWMPQGICSRVLFLDVSNPTINESSLSDSPYENPMEAKAIAQFLHYLHYWNVSWNRIAVLTPYRKQKKLLKHVFLVYFQSFASNEQHSTTLHDQPVSIFTTDEFQGKEKDIILISLVSSSLLTGHLRDERRINVLTSRARCAIYLFGNYSVFHKHQEWTTLLDQISSSHLCAPISPSQHSSFLTPLCRNAGDSQSICVWKRKDVFVLLEEWLKEQSKKQKEPLELLFSQWKI
ncbi:Intron-binding protein aquarius [Galdieria sulphuraria]|nr:Intron-binding protein aquarius [Galdieria sulphuraria]